MGPKREKESDAEDDSKSKRGAGGALRERAGRLPGLFPNLPRMECVARIRSLRIFEVLLWFRPQ